MTWLNENISVLTQFVTLFGVAASVFVSVWNGRRITATKDDVHQVHELVNGKTEKLETLIKEKAFKAGVAEGKGAKG